MNSYDIVVVVVVVSTTILWSLYKSTCVSWHPHLRTGVFLEPSLLLHALVNDNQHMQMREKILELLSTMLPSLSPLSLLLLLVSDCMRLLF